MSNEPMMCGDCAKLREALKAVKMYLDGYTVNILELRRTVDAALSAPPRNCDRFKTKEDAALAYAKEDNAFIPQSILWQIGEWLDWIFAPAAEQKGGNDGR